MVAFAIIIISAKLCSGQWVNYQALHHSTPAPLSSPKMNFHSFPSLLHLSFFSLHIILSMKSFLFCTSELCSLLCTWKFSVCTSTLQHLSLWCNFLLTWLSPLWDGWSLGMGCVESASELPLARFPALSPRFLLFLLSFIDFGPARVLQWGISAGRGQNEGTDRLKVPVGNIQDKPSTENLLPGTRLTFQNH